MQSTLLVVFGYIVLLAILYFLLLAIFKILKQLIEGSQSALKGIFIMTAVLGSSYFLLNQERCPEIIEKVKYYFHSDQPDVPDYYDFNQ